MLGFTKIVFIFAPCFECRYSFLYEREEVWTQKNIFDSVPLGDISCDYCLWLYSRS